MKRKRTIASQDGTAIPQVPPPSVPIRSYPTPVNGEGFYTEVIDTSKPDYVPLKRGQKYSTLIGSDPLVAQQFPELYFLKETVLPYDFPWATRLWATDRDAEDSYNSAVEYVSNAVLFPAYTRLYMVRRDEYDENQTVPIGSPLTSLIGVRIIEPGGDYTFATAEVGLPGTGATVEIVLGSGGIVQDGIVTNSGSGYVTAPPIIIDGDGVGATAVGIIQPQSAVLTQQKKTELGDDHPLRNEYVLVTRVYETLPGPWVYSSKIDQDGIETTVRKRRNISANIVVEEGVTGNLWSETDKNGDDAFVAEEVNQFRTVVTNDSERDDQIAAGNTLESSKPDEDGKSITIQKLVATADYVDSIDPREEIDAGVWARISSEPIDSHKVWLVLEKRVIPGNPIPSVSLDPDGTTIEEVRTLKESSTIVEVEDDTGGFWTRTVSKAVTELVAWEVVTIQPLPGQNIPSANVDGDEEVNNVNERRAINANITPSSSEAGGFITTVEAVKVSDLISIQKTTVRRWLDKASYSLRIPESIIPIEFRAKIPTVTEVHILAGTASMPTLIAGDLFREERQLTKNLYALTTEGFGENLVFPINQQGFETSSVYGGAVLEVNRTLHNLQLFASEGEDIVSSEVQPIGDNLMWFRTTKNRPATDLAWPVIASRLWDENMRLEYDQTEQVVVAGTSEDADPGGVFAWNSQVKGIDKWRSQIINTSKPTPDYVDESTALVAYEYKPYRFPGLIYFSGTGYYVRHADATLTQHLIKTWWIQSSNPPTPPAIDEIIMDDVVINNLTLNGLAYSGPALHDDLQSGNLLFYPATTPSATQYSLGTPTGGTSLHNSVGIYSPGTTGGYTVGSTITITGFGHSVTADVTAIYDVGTITGLIGGLSTNPGGTFPASQTIWGPFGGSGGGGAGAFFQVFAFETPNYTPGTAWIGTYRIVGATVTPEREKNVWKIMTESVVMR